MFKYFVEDKFRTKIYNFVAYNCALKIKYDIVKKYKANSAKKKKTVISNNCYIIILNIRNNTFPKLRVNKIKVINLIVT